VDIGARQNGLGKLPPLVANVLYMNNTANPYKGTPIALQVVDNTLTVWLSSPTGDSTDSHRFTIQCLTVRQAYALAKVWQDTWGIDPRYCPQQETSQDDCDPHGIPRPLIPMRSDF
jgi:hypothetical protein